MTRLLHLDSSITGENSVTRQLSAKIVAQLRPAVGGDIVYRDLVADPLDHLTLGAYADREVLDEFLAADTVVIGAPMYNFTLPSQLKAWLDRIVIAGTTFRYLPDGTPEGLVGGKRVIVALSRGGFYGAGSAAAGLEHLETYLRGVFGFIGINPEFVAADGISAGPELKARGVEQANREVDRLAA